MNEETELTAAEKRQVKIDDARSMLTFLEAHPELELPTSVSWNWMHLYGESDRDAFMAYVVAFGTFEKDLSDERKYKISKQFGTATIEVEIDRAVVCQKVKVMKEVEEWQCPSLLEIAEVDAMAGVEVEKAF